MSIESDLIKIIKEYNTTLPVYPFSVPDNVTDPVSCAYQRIGNRQSQQYYNKTEQVEESLFIVTMLSKNFDLITEDTEFILHINKYCKDHILNVDVTDYRDDQNDVGFYEREYSIVITHLRVM